MKQAELIEQEVLDVGSAAMPTDVVFDAVVLDAVLTARCQSSVWLDTWQSHYAKNGVRVGVACPALYSQGADIEDSVPDDFCADACRQELDEFNELFTSRFEVRHTGHIRFDSSLDKELWLLHRTVRADVTNDCVTIEADQKNVATMLRDMKFRMAASYMMTEQTDSRGRPLEMATWDVSRTHLYGEARRWTYVTLPEGCERANKVTRFGRAMYGKQDASNAVLGLQSYFDDCGAKLRHIQVRHIWLQQRVKLGHLKIATVRGIDNPADCLTKALTEADLKRHCEAVGQRWLS